MNRMALKEYFQDFEMYEKMFAALHEEWRMEEHPKANTKEKMKKLVF